VNAIDAAVLRAARAHGEGQARRSAAPRRGGAEARPPGEASNDFARVNDAAMQNLGAWVPALLPAARTATAIA
jgi:hypothetical protein